MRIALASDHAAVELRLAVAAHLTGRGDQVDDLGCAAHERVDYPDYAARVTSAISAGSADVGVLICGTGIGMSMAANKVAGIRAALVHDATTARLAREHNDANVLCVGGRVLGPLTVLECLDAWLDASFEPRHADRLAKLHALEAR